MQMLKQKARTKSTKIRQKMLVAKCLPMQYSLWQGSLRNNSQKGFSLFAHGVLCVVFSEASVSHNYKGLSLHLFLVVTAESQILVEAMKERRCQWSVLGLQYCIRLDAYRCNTPEQVVGASRCPVSLQTTTRADDIGARWSPRI
jgi:hypothetical protein